MLSNESPLSRIIGFAAVVAGIGATASHQVAPLLGWAVIGLGVLLLFAKSGNPGRNGKGWEIDMSIIRRVFKK